MSRLTLRVALYKFLAVVLLASVVVVVSSAQEKVGVTEITPNVLVFSTTAGNVVACVGPDGALYLRGTWCPEWSLL